MPVSALWSLVICFAGLALGLAYKVAELTHRSDRLNKEAETLRSELDTFQKGKDKEISDIKEFHQRDVEELKKEIAKFSHVESNPLFLKFGVYWDKGGNPYCPKCKTPTSQTTWATYINRQFRALLCSCSDMPIILMENGEPVQAQEIMKRMAIDAEINRDGITTSLDLP